MMRARAAARAAEAVRAIAALRRGCRGLTLALRRDGDDRRVAREVLLEHVAGVFLDVDAAPSRRALVDAHGGAVCHLAEPLCVRERLLADREGRRGIGEGVLGLGGMLGEEGVSGEEESEQQPPLRGVDNRAFANRYSMSLHPSLATLTLGRAVARCR